MDSLYETWDDKSLKELKSTHLVFQDMLRERQLNLRAAKDENWKEYWQKKVDDLELSLKEIKIAIAKKEGKPF